MHQQSPPPATGRAARHPAVLLVPLFLLSACSLLRPEPVPQRLPQIPSAWAAEADGRPPAPFRET
ncbi:MAG TPA: hypothetical protein ENJ43_03370, partial [Gammaproteobacteria bacterium]|nr:hypothetical protein [Gammaproteobacteria bacterium]